MERLLKAQRLAMEDVERGVTMEMVKKVRENRNAEKEQVIIDNAKQEVIVPLMKDSKNDAIDHLLATIDATEALEDKLRAKYNM